MRLILAVTAVTFFALTPIFDTAAAEPKFSIKSIAPNSGPDTGGTKVTIKGRSLSSVKQVLFGDSPASISRRSSSSLVVFTPARGASLANITLVDKKGRFKIFYSKFTYTLTQQPPPSDPPPQANMPTPGNNTSLNGFKLFPSTDLWNTDISSAPVDPDSDRYMNAIGRSVGVHPDFGTVWEGRPIGIPYTVVPANQPKISVDFSEGYPDESDTGPYPVPSAAAVEGGDGAEGDRHVLLLDAASNKLYELFLATKVGENRWKAYSGAIYDLSRSSVGQRPMCWTSADAAGLPILPGLVRLDEVQSGEITHALRFTLPQTRQAFVPPASHFASSSFDLNRLPMGARLRLKEAFNVEQSHFSPEVKVILRALKKYGMILADNGSALYLSGAPDPAWNDDQLHALQSYVHGDDFEVIKLDLFGTMVTGWGSCP